MLIVACIQPHFTAPELAACRYHAKLLLALKKRKKFYGASCEIARCVLNAEVGENGVFPVILYRRKFKMAKLPGGITRNYQTCAAETLVIILNAYSIMTVPL